MLLPVRRSGNYSRPTNIRASPSVAASRPALFLGLRADFLALALTAGPQVVRRDGLRSPRFRFSVPGSTPGPNAWFRAIVRIWGLLGSAAFSSPGELEDYSRGYGGELDARETCSVRVGRVCPSLFYCADRNSYGHAHGKGVACDPSEKHPPVSHTLGMIAAHSAQDRLCSCPRVCNSGLSEERNVHHSGPW